MNGAAGSTPAARIASAVPGGTRSLITRATKRRVENRLSLLAPANAPVPPALAPTIRPFYANERQATYQGAPPIGRHNDGASSRVNKACTCSP